MFNLKSTKNKVLATILLEVIFTILIILLLVFVRQKTIGYLYDVQGLSYEISNLEQDLATQNLTSYDKQQVESTLDEADSILTKGLLLMWLFLPLSLIVISLVFYFFIWRIISKVSIKRFLYSSIVPIITLLVFVYFLLSYISYKFYFVEKSPLAYLVIFTIILIFSYYFSLFLLSNNKPLKQNINLAKKNLPKLALPFILNLITNFVYLVLIFVMFFLTYVKASIIIISIILLAIIIIINLQRIHLAKKISKLN